jgi:hypothetical protein
MDKVYTRIRYKRLNESVLETVQTYGLPDGRFVKGQVDLLQMRTSVYTVDNNQELSSSNGYKNPRLAKLGLKSLLSGLGVVFTDELRVSRQLEGEDSTESI